MDFFNEQELTFEQVKALTAGMFAVAKVDGVHDREMSMIRSFYEGCSRTGDPRLEDVLQGDFDVEKAKALFDRPEQARLFVKTLILLAYADGSYAAKEEEVIRKVAGRLGLAAGEVQALHESTKEYLLSSLAHVQNVSALESVAKELKLGQSDGARSE
jgi:uncharacterized tellurite resistance protein B-like protein